MLFPQMLPTLPPCEGKMHEKTQGEGKETKEVQEEVERKQDQDETQEQMEEIQEGEGGNEDQNEGQTEEGAAPQGAQEAEETQ